MSSWTLQNTEKGNKREFDSRSDAEDQRSKLVGIGADPENLEVVPPGKELTDNHGTPLDELDTKADGGTETKQAEVVDDTQSTSKTDSDQLTDAHKLPDEPQLEDSPIEWMPGSFTDKIQGQQVINRQGYEIMARYYDIGTKSKCLVGPEDTDFEYCRVQATATTSDGISYQAHGSAHIDREDGDDPTMLLEMADTRARKRALAQATGTGLLAVEELKNEL